MTFTDAVALLGAVADLIADFPIITAAVSAAAIVSGAIMLGKGMKRAAK